MNAGDGRQLNDCGCCEGLDVETPVDIWNAPGLNALAYRVGTHSRFKRSMLVELARAIGYELRPGVAASTYFRFTLEAATGAPTEVTVSSGTKAQSIPGENEQAQIFETVEEIKARPAWNELRPRATEPQEFEIKD